MVDTVGGTVVTRRRLDEARILSIRRTTDDVAAQAALQQRGLAWPSSPGGVEGDNPAVLWRSPSEVLVVGTNAACGAVMSDVADSLRAGRHAHALALDVSDQIAVVELAGAGLDDWLHRLVDAWSLPRSGHVTRGRLREIAVLFHRTGPERIRLLLDRTLLTYLEAWLTTTRATTSGKEAE